MIAEPGVYQLPLEEYLSDPAIEPSLSSHVAHVALTRSMLHARHVHPRLNPDYQPEVGAALELGTLAHRLVLEGRSDGIVIVDAKDFRSRAAQTARDEARARGKVPVLTAQWTALETMTVAWLRQFADLDPVPFRGGKAEQSYFWQDDGVWCRARPDYVAPWGLEELKTTSTNGHPAEWGRRRLWESGAALQAAFHVRALTQATRHRVDAHRIIVCEVDPPYAVSALSLDPEGFELADAMRARAVELWREGLLTNRWPGYPARVAYCEPPPWIKATWIERAYYE